MGSMRNLGIHKNFEIWKYRKKFQMFIDIQAKCCNIFLQWKPTYITALYKHMFLTII
jgi:hypothetical protein